jgi:uncharacterized protein (TIGR03437 family)
MRLVIVATLLLAANCLRAAGPAACAPSPATVMPPAPFDGSGNAMLNGAYYLRYVQYTVGDQYGDFSRAIAIYQSITFHGDGTYSMSGLEIDSNVGQLTPCALNSNGYYSISAGGYGYITNPVYPGDLIWGLVSPAGAQGNVFVGSTTETQNGYNDLFIAAKIGSSSATAASLNNHYSVAYMNFPDGYVTDTVAAGFQMYPNGAGTIGTVNIQSFKGAGSAVNVSEPASYFFANGVGVLTFPSYGQAIAGQEYLYISTDGSLIFGGSPNAFDIFVGVQTGTTSAEFAGLYYQAGIDVNLSTTAGTVYGAIQTYYGAFNAIAGNIYNHQRILAPLRPQPQPMGYYAPPYSLTGLSKVSLAFSSGGGYIDAATQRQYVIGANGTTRLGFCGKSVLGISIALRAPAGPNPPPAGPYINPAGVVNAASYAPFTAGISAGDAIAIYGLNLAPPGQGSSGQVTVSINNIPAQVEYAYPNQVAAVVPPAVTGPYAQIQVTTNGAPSNTVWAQVYPTTLGVFTQAQNGLGDAIAQRSDGTLVTPSNPAKANDMVVVDVTGLGALIQPGLLPSSTYMPVSAITATIGGAAAAVSYPTLTPSATGVDKITITVPSGLTVGENTLAISAPDSQTVQSTISIGAGSASTTSSMARQPDATSLSYGNSFERFGPPRALFSGLHQAQGARTFAVSRDGSRIFWLQGTEQPDSNMIYIKTGWAK